MYFLKQKIDVLYIEANVCVLYIRQKLACLVYCVPSPPAYWKRGIWNMSIISLSRARHVIKTSFSFFKKLFFCFFSVFLC